MKTLRQRILRYGGICCTPWRIWKGELEYVALSFKTCFKKDGIPIDVVEQELRDEGWIFEDESLLEVMKDKGNLKRTLVWDEKDSDYGNFPSDWTEEDYK
jgi:hypothetical protein